MKFIDLFCGMGNFRAGMEQAGHECVYSCEWDKHKRKIYGVIYGEEPTGSDIRAVSASDIPRSDCWCFGFPCQDISVAGKQLGLSGERSGLFHEVMRILQETKEEDRPKYLFIENVKNLLSVNSGWDFFNLLYCLDEIGYDAEWQLVNSKDHGVPQNRERVFIIGHYRGRSTRKVLPIIKTMDCKNPAVCLTKRGYGSQRNGTYVIKDTRVVRAILTPGRMEKRQNGRRYKKHNEPMFTLTKQDRHGVIIDEEIRILTPKECMRLQGVYDEVTEKLIKAGISDSQLYIAAGDAVTIPVIYKIAKRL